MLSVCAADVVVLNYGVEPDGIIQTQYLHQILYRELETNVWDVAPVRTDAFLVRSPSMMRQVWQRFSRTNASDAVCAQPYARRKH